MPTNTLNRTGGVYLINSNDSLIISMERFFKRNGVVAVIDEAGKTHYLVDARRGSKAFGNSLLNKILPSGDDYFRRDSIINQVLEDHDFNMGLIGTSMLALMIRENFINDTERELSVRDYLYLVAEYFNTSIGNADRVIRYAVSKSDFGSMGYRTNRIVNELAAEVKERVREAIEIKEGCHC